MPPNLYGDENGPPAGIGWCGTSMSTPHVTATVAILRGEFPSPTVDDIRDILFQTAYKAPGQPSGWDNKLGWGVVDAGAAVALASGSVGGGGTGPPCPDGCTTEMRSPLPTRFIGHERQR
ncbi:MAG: S8 family serine peptidase [Gemmatimonadales bacterium]